MSHSRANFPDYRDRYRKAQWDQHVTLLGYLPYPNHLALDPAACRDLKETWKSIADKSFQRQPFANGAR